MHMHVFICFRIDFNFVVAAAAVDTCVLSCPQHVEGCMGAIYGLLQYDSKKLIALNSLRSQVS